MSFETAAPPPEPPPLPPEHVQVVEQPPGLLPPAPQARPAAGYEATAVIAGLGGPPPGVTTYRLRGTETTRVE